MERRSARVNASLFIGDVTSASGWRVPTAEAIPLGVTRDWSETGVFIETEARPPVDSVVEVSFVWGDDSVRSRARVVRHDTTGIGLDFVEPPAAFCHAVRGVMGEAG